MAENTESKNDLLKGIYIGHVVRLRSGGPYMTVKELAGSAVRCTWFNDKVNMEHVFHVDQIEFRSSHNVVRLKSGGPFMTFLETVAEGDKCIWFDQNGIFCERTFPSGCLRVGEFPEEIPSL